MKKYLPGPEPYTLQFEAIGDATTGFLVSSQKAANLPFDVKRVFWVYDTPEQVMRGGHANRVTEEVMVALTGSVTVETETSTGVKQTFELKNPTVGLYIPVFCWLTIRFSPGTTLFCLTSTDFDEADYIQDLAAFRNLKKTGQENL